MGVPTGVELGAWMVAQRLLSAEPGDLTALDAAASAAAEAFEGATFWSPLLAPRDVNGDLVAETRRFDGPEGYTLFPGVGILSVATLKVGGTTLVEDEGYYLQDRKLGRYAFQSIEFALWQPGTRRHVEVTGVFGLFETLPADVTLALLSKAAAGISTDSTSTGALKREKAGPVEYEYDVAAGATTKTATLNAVYDAAVAKYVRRA